MPTTFAGQTLIQPQVQSAVDDTALSAAGISASSVVAVVGSSLGGAPNTPTYFTNAQQALNTLRGGNMMDVIRRVFNPGAGNTGAARVCAIRVNSTGTPATRSTLTLQATGAVNTIVLTSVDYGLWNNQISVAVAAGTSQGLKLTTTFPAVGQPPRSIVNDNVYRPLFSVAYLGSGTTPTISITSTAITTICTGQAPDQVNFTFATYPTIQAMVNAFNAWNGGTKYVATILGLGTEATNTLDGLSTATLSIVAATPTVILANLQASIDAFNAGGIMTGVRSTSLLQPAVVSATYLTGGADPLSPSTADWTTAIAALETEAVGIVVPAIDTAAIHASLATHITNMSTTKRERIAIVGGTTGESVSASLTRAQNFGNDRIGLVFPGITDPDPNTGVLTTYAPFVTAGAVAGLLAGGAVQRAATFRYIGPQGMERALSNSEVDQLLSGGVIPVQSVPNKGFRVVQSLSTYTASASYVHNELSVRRNADVVSATIRDNVEPLLASTTGPDLVGTVYATVQTSLLTLFNNGLLVGTLGSPTSPPFKNIAVSAAGNVVSIQFSAQIGVPANYITIVAHLSAFSS